MTPVSEDEIGWDEERAASYVGKYILVGIANLDSAGELKHLQQMHGVIESASFETGISISLRGAYEGETWSMPPLLNAIRTAKPGRYELQMSGEIVEDPDLLATWEVREPPEGGWED